MTLALVAAPGCFVPAKASAMPPPTTLTPTADATVTAIEDGLWSSPATWGGNLPAAGDRVYIPADRSVQYDVSSDALLHWIRVDGELKWRTDTGTELFVDTIIVAPTGTLTVGDAAHPIEAGILARIVFPSGQPIDTTWDNLLRSRGIVSMGTFEVHGQPRQAFAEVSGDLDAGETTITLRNPVPANWRVGEEIVLTGTSFDLGDDNFSHDDLRVIQAISGNAITVAPLDWDHHRPADHDVPLYAAHLTRNIRFETRDHPSAPIQQRAHLMFRSADTHVAHAAFIGLGRTNKDLLVTDPALDGSNNLIPGTGDNARGRYPLHFHLVGTAHAVPESSIEGCVIRHSPGWGVAVHGSKAVVRDCVSYDVLGAHYVTEDGNDLARFIDNIAIRSRGAESFPVADLLGGGDARANAEDFGARGMGFWFDSTYSAREVRGNIVSGVRDAGMIIYGTNDFDPPPNISTDTIDPALQHIAGGEATYPSWAVPVGPFSGNTVFNACGGVEYRGNNRDDSGFGTSSAGHQLPGIFDTWTIWGVREFGMHITYSSYITIRDSLVLGDPANPLLRQGGDSGPSPKGGGIFLNKNARGVTVENTRIEGFENALTVGQTGGQGYNTIDEPPFTHMRVIGGHFENNLFHLEPVDGRTGNAASNHFLQDPPFNPWFELIGDPVFIPPAGTTAPAADFTHDAIGGLAVRFDASASFDPDFPLGDGDPQPTAFHDTPYPSWEAFNDNTLAAYRWDFDGDGSADGKGRFPVHVYDAPGSYSVTLTIYDQHGLTDEATYTVDVQDATMQNRLVDGDISSPGGTFNINSGEVRWNNFNRGWYRPGGHQWSKDAVNGWAVADGSGGGASGLVQVIHDQRVLRGPQLFSFQFLNKIGGNGVRAKIWGVNGQFSVSNWNQNGPVSVSNVHPLESTLLFEQDFDEAAPDWVQLDPASIDFGSGYDFVIVGFWTDSVSGSDLHAIDNIVLGNPEDIEPPPPPDDDPTSGPAYGVNILKNGDFSQGGDMFYKAGANASNNESDKGWVHPNGHFWSRDITEEWTYGFNGGAQALTQVVESLHAHTGDYTLAFDLKNTEGSGSSNTFRILIYGIDGAFSTSRWGIDPLAGSTTLHDSGNLAAGSSFDWTRFTADVDLGSGYDYILVYIAGHRVSASEGDFLALDNISLSLALLDYDTWVALQPWQGADSSRAGDADADQKNNFYEYGLNLNALEPADEQDLTIGREVVGEDTYITIIFRKPADRGDVAYVALGAPTPGGPWSEEAPAAEVPVEPAADGTPRVKWRFPMTEPNRYYRLLLRETSSN